MNYQVITDEEALRKFVDWLPELQENEKFYLSLFARKKYSQELIKSNDKTQLRRFTSDKERLIEKIRQLELPLGRWKLKEIDAPQEALVLYIAINPRCMKKATEMMGRKCWDLMKSKNYNLHAEAMSCIQKSKSRSCYVDFDIDDKAINIDVDWLNETLGKDNFTVIETRGGYHILVQPEQATAYRLQHFGDKNWYSIIQKKYPVDQSGDQLVPVVGTFQGGFTPRFL